MVTNRGRPSDYKHGGRKSVSAGDSGNSPATPSPFSPGVVGSLTSPSVDSPSSATTHKPVSLLKSGTCKYRSNLIIIFDTSFIYTLLCSSVSVIT